MLIVREWKMNLIEVVDKQGNYIDQIMGRKKVHDLNLLWGQ